MALKKMMKLKRALRLHSSKHPKLALKDVLGDGYLLSRNAMYARTRELALNFGYRFAPAWENYKRASLFELPIILKKKMIPYNDSVPTLIRLVRDHDFDEDMIDVLVNLTSYHFHEAAHGVSDAVLKPVKAKSAREKVLSALLCESYANATESMAVTFVDDEIQQFFLEHNSYIYATPERAYERQQAFVAWGPTALFRILWLSYLFANFLVDDVSTEELESALQFALQKDKITKKDREMGAQLFANAYELNENFRLKTAKLYMRMLGIKGNIRKTLAFDFTHLLTNNREFRQAFDRLTEMTALDLKP